MPPCAAWTHGCGPVASVESSGRNRAFRVHTLHQNARFFMIPSASPNKAVGLYPLARIVPVRLCRYVQYSTT